MNLNKWKQCSVYKAMLDGSVFEVVQANPLWLAGGGDTLGAVSSTSAALDQLPSLGAGLVMG